MSSLLPRSFHRSILLSVGLLMTLVVVLAILGMSIGSSVGRATEGFAAAVNQAGSLRMQSYRIGMALADTRVPADLRADRVAELAEELEKRLASPRLADIIPRRAGEEIRAAYEGIRTDWNARMRPLVSSDIARLRALDPGTSRDPPAMAYLGDVDGFVEQIDLLVGELERITEARLAMLRVVQAVALVLTVLVVLVTMVLVIGRVIQPLAELLECADGSRRGDFTRRTRFTGNDELGRLGEAMNRMAADLSQLYTDLEGRVAEKTRDLERSNQTLELLYGVGQALHEAPISIPVFERVLQEIRVKLRLRAVTLCLDEAPDLCPDPDRHRKDGRSCVRARAEGEHRFVCSSDVCPVCREAEPFHPLLRTLGRGERRSPVSFVVAEQDRPFGALIVELERDQSLPPWQGRLLASLATLVGTALSLHRRQRDGRRLALFEERGVIARELHDSLAQSLSYLKIQASRLDALLGAGAQTERTRAVLGELREGVNNAYRQLRELLTTFRLKMDDRGLNAALEATVAEYGARGTTEICLDNRLPALLLSPNEEIHVLQIVREALSNVVRHAGAAHALLRLAAGGAGIRVTLDDDGRGIDPHAVPRGHYGLSIMRERAAGLGGDIEIAPGPHGGTRVRLTFPSRRARDIDAEVSDAGAIDAVQTS
ncbi:type IV pili methyl-accepting chemotaxis transducer N-terminal domain-containing protein [Thiocapsa sp.]|uniref:type IV pili methyl-accepting chemotaxis transducer N-terminal domain-containing protein n=1 Tax=Thiocapsa sp. TaxID=2024551 RepID=UPI002BF4B8A9|nr:type IV pili methyl-accepting chemotaxis transducer N-terminal domain-containing protein [Thiocapsa sp.]HSO84856.1 type IV pili methyl-accepting chemotaxis transducer N-terminal domain-containing protein [Thiocapsa sp.]